MPLSIEREEPEEAPTRRARAHTCGRWNFCGAGGGEGTPGHRRRRARSERRRWPSTGTAPSKIEWQHTKKVGFRIINWITKHKESTIQNNPLQKNNGTTKARFATIRRTRLYNSNTNHYNGIYFLCHPPHPISPPALGAPRGLHPSPEEHGNISHRMATTSM